MGLRGLNKMKMFAMAGLSLLAVSVTSISTFAWFQINNSVSPSTNIQTNGVRTDAFVYNKNSGHSHDDTYNTGVHADDGGTQPYDHSNSSAAVDFYIVGDGGTFASMDWDVSKALQMYDNPNNTSDLATYFRLHLTTNTEFKIVKGSSNASYDWNNVSGASTMIACFGESDSGHYIKCTTEGTYDIYINYQYEIFLQKHEELTDDTQLGNMVGYYIVGSSTNSNGPFYGSDFDFSKSYSLQVGDNDYPKGAYYGLHLYTGDLFKIWDGRTRESAGWYGYQQLDGNPKYDGANSCFSYDNTTNYNISCAYEGYYDIFLSGTGSTHRITIKFHTENTPSRASRAPSPTIGPKKVALTSSTYFYLNLTNNTQWERDSARMKFNFNDGTHYWPVFGERIDSDAHIWRAAVPDSSVTKIQFLRWGPTTDDRQYNYSNNADITTTTWNGSSVTSNMASLANSWDGGSLTMGYFGYYATGPGAGGNWTVGTGIALTSGTTSATASNVRLYGGEEFKITSSTGSIWFGTQNTSVTNDGYYDISWTISNSSTNTVATLTLINKTAYTLRRYVVPFAGEPVAISSVQIAYNSSYSLANPAAADWPAGATSFVGWYTAASGGTSAASTITGTGADDPSPIYARFNFTSYTVTTYYILGTGNPVEIDSQSVLAGGTYTLDALPSAARWGYAYTAVGWYTDSTHTGNTVAPGNKTINADTKYYAYFAPSGSNITVYFDVNAVKSSWELSSSKTVYLHCWYDVANQVGVQYDYECTPINGSSSAYQYIWYKATINSNVASGGMVLYVDDYNHQTTNITTSIQNGSLYTISSDCGTGDDASKNTWTNTSTSCSGQIRSVTVSKSGGASGTIGTYYLLDHESWIHRSSILENIADVAGYITPTTLNSEPDGSGTPYAVNASIEISGNTTLYAYYAAASFYLNGTHDGVGKWTTSQYISNSCTISGSTLSFTGINLSAKDVIKVFSANAGANGDWLPSSSESYTSTTYAKQVSSPSPGGNVEIRYSGTYTISCTVDSSNYISDLVVTATSLDLTNFEINSTNPTSVDSSSGFVFTWTNLTFNVGTEFAVETASSATDTVVFGAWGFSQGSFTATHYYKGSASSVDGSVNKIGSVFHKTGVTVTFNLNTNAVTISDGTTGNYSYTGNTNAPTGIYLAYGSNAPSSLADAANTQRMFYDSDTSYLYYSGDNTPYDKKASYSILTVATTVKCKIFHGLDYAEAPIYTLTNSPLYTSSSAQTQIYPDSTSVTGVSQPQGETYFVLTAGSYVITLIGKMGQPPGENPATSGSGYAIAVKRVTGAKNTANEHEVPIYAIGRGMPGSELENGDYTYAKVKVGNYTYNRYIPFYAIAGQNTNFPCYAKTQDNSSTTITLKAGDEFVFSDGITTKASFDAGSQDTASAVISSGGKISVKQSGTYTISSARGNSDTLSAATFTITAVTLESSVQDGNDASLQSNDSNPVAYSKQHGVRVLNSTGSTINFGGVYDSSLLDSGKDYVSFYIELRHINPGTTSGTLSAAFSSLPSGATYRYFQKKGESTDVTAIDNTPADDSNLWSSWVSTASIFSGAALDPNTNKVAGLDYCYALSTIIEVKIPYSSLAANTERVTYSLSFSINITYTETITA